MIEPARDSEEAWRIMESYFNREMRILDELIDDILSHERMVNDPQTLAHYSRILMAIRDAKQLGRLSDLLTNDRIKALMRSSPGRRTVTESTIRWGCATRTCQSPSTPS